MPRKVPEREAMSIEEVQEHAEHAKDPFDKRVAATMAMVAAVLAVVSVLGHICTTEEIVLQQRAADQWSFSQAKNIRRYESEIALDLLNKDDPSTAPRFEKYKNNLARYEKETEENQGKARELEAERDVKGKQALRLHFGGVFLEISIVLASLAILSKRSLLWLVAIGSSVVGVIVAATTGAIH